MKGFFKMLSGQGEKEYREQHKAFDDAIPDRYEDHIEEHEWQWKHPDSAKRAKTHPAYSGPMENSLDAANYRRAHQMRGPQSKAEHEAFAEYQRTHGPDGRRIVEEKPVRALTLLERLLPRRR
jgi:hypothetical protein